LGRRDAAGLDLPKTNAIVFRRLLADGAEYACHSPTRSIRAIICAR
jgi:hypothetical protein